MDNRSNIQVEVRSLGQPTRCNLAVFGFLHCAAGFTPEAEMLSFWNAAIYNSHEKAQHPERNFALGHTSQWVSYRSGVWD